MRKPRYSLLLSVLLGFLAACGAAAPTAAPAPDSAASQTITVYTALENEALALYVPLFERAHPEIKLTIVRESTGPITEKFLNEKANPQADVIWGVAATSLLVADQEGLLEPYAPAGLERVEPTFRDGANPPKWVGIDVWETAFCVNQELLASKNIPVPQSWADLVKPIYKDQLVMPDPTASGTGYMSVIGLVQTMGEEEAWAFQDQIHANVHSYVPSGSTPCKMAGKGEIPIGVSFGYRAIIEQQAGNPILAIWPKEGSGWDVEANALVRKAAIKPAAKVFLDWAISDVIIKEYAKNYPLTSVKSGLPIIEGYLTDPLKQLIKNDLSFAALNRERILAEWQKRYAAKTVK